MNAITIRRTAAWILAALLTLVAGLGEALHWLPGLGHGIVVGERVLLLGLPPAGPREAFGPRVCCAGAPCGTSVPVLDEDDCPICQVLSNNFESDAAAAMPAVDLVAGQPIDPPALNARLAPVVYHARGPPLSTASASLG